MEGEERYAERQHDIELRHRPAEHEAKIVGKEVRVFEHGENDEIEHYRRSEDRRQFRPRISDHGQPVAQDRQHQQQNERRIAVAVEGERQQHQHAYPPLGMGIGKAINQEGCRKENQQEWVVIEKH